jgi:hypothetical protein
MSRYQTIDSVRKGLDSLPPESVIYAYEGECVGLVAVVIEKNTKNNKVYKDDTWKEVGFLPTGDPR